MFTKSHLFHSQYWHLQQRKATIWKVNFVWNFYILRGISRLGCYALFKSWQMRKIEGVAKFILHQSLEWSISTYSLIYVEGRKFFKLTCTIFPALIRQRPYSLKIRPLKENLKSDYIRLHTNPADIIAIVLIFCYLFIYRFKKWQYLRSWKVPEQLR